MPMATRKKPVEAYVFQIKVTLLHTKPPIWRRVLVPASIKLSELHEVLNELMGWENAHLHSFAVGDRTFVNLRDDPDASAEYEDERKVRLDALVEPGKSFHYVYDFGDGWRHTVVVEKRLDHDPRFEYPMCVDGARACPPEDCGGPPGYDNLLRVLANKRDAEHDEMLTWVGGHFDPDGFDINRTNQALRGLLG